MMLLLMFIIDAQPDLVSIDTNNWQQKDYK